MATPQLKRQLVKLFHAQDGRCHYCSCEMTLERPKRGEKTPINMATTEHLEDSYDPNRGKMNPDGRTIRHVAACWKCNNDRNKVRQADTNVVSKEELWKRSGRKPTVSLGQSGVVPPATTSAPIPMAFWKRAVTTAMALFSRLSTRTTSPAGEARG